MKHIINFTFGTVAGILMCLAFVATGNLCIMALDEIVHAGYSAYTPLAVIFPVVIGAKIAWDCRNL